MNSAWLGTLIFVLIVGGAGVYFASKRKGQ